MQAALTKQKQKKCKAKQTQQKRSASYVIEFKQLNVDDHLIRQTNIFTRSANVLIRKSLEPNFLLSFVLFHFISYFCFCILF